MRKLFILTILLGLCAYNNVCAQSVSQWCLKTDQGQYIEMARVAMLAAVDGQAAFEVVVREGQGAVGVKSITFEMHESDYVAPADDKPVVITETGPWCLITDAGDSIAMSRVAMLASVDRNSQFEVVTTDGANKVGVSTARFGRGKSNDSGGFKPISGEGGSTTDPNRYNPWCMITDKNDTIAMSRVQMIANVDGSNAFEVVVSDGANVTGAKYVRFAHGNSPVKILWAGHHEFTETEISALKFFSQVGDATSIPRLVFTCVEQPAIKGETILLSGNTFEENWTEMIAELSRRGMHRLMVEPGAHLSAKIFGDSGDRSGKITPLWNRLDLWKSTDPSVERILSQENCQGIAFPGVPDSAVAKESAIIGPDVLTVYYPG